MNHSLAKATPNPSEEKHKISLESFGITTQTQLEYVIHEEFKDIYEQLKKEVRVAIGKDNLLTIHTSTRSVTIVYDGKKDGVKEYQKLREEHIKEGYIIELINSEPFIFVDVDLIERVGVSESTMFFHWKERLYFLDDTKENELREVSKSLESYFKKQGREKQFIRLK